MYDIAVVGCGIAGASVAYHANVCGLKTAIIEKSDPSLNASSAAGAFLSPKFGPASSYSSLINRAFVYSRDLYKEHFSEFLDECGMLRLPRSEDELEKCESYAAASPFWKKQNGGFWCAEAALIKPLETIKKMASHADIYEADAKGFFYEDGLWHIGGVEAKHLVLASGYKLLFDEPYLYIKRIFGQKLEAKCERGFAYSVHRKCSVSPFSGGKVQIGASHIVGWHFQDNEEIFAQYAAKLTREAEELLGQKVEVVAQKRGFRSATMDYFPYCGQIIDAKSTLIKNPSLMYGTIANEKNFVYHPNIWLHQGHGARGFVLAPYTAKHLIGQIVGEQSVESEIRLKRAFLRYARKAKI